ncbi:cytochrome C [Achromatium sp. WMS3]|nr:cytochrome C [Achromatium sp. WMS3]
MRRLLILAVLILTPILGFTSGGGISLETANIDLHDKASLQRGAKYFMNYCAGCHSLKYARYNRMARDLGLTDKQVQDNLMFVSGSKVGNQITISMSEAQGEKWFGAPVPDLTLVTRNKIGGSDWLYTYLKSFYIDPKRPYGVNNAVFPDVAMPDVLAELRGTQTIEYKEGKNAAGQPIHVFKQFRRHGGLSNDELDRVFLDLTAFLTYMGEPMQLERRALGKWVLLFLAVFTLLAFLLKKEYWRDVH